MKDNIKKIKGEEKKEEKKRIKSGNGIPVTGITPITVDILMNI